jgi:CDGSH-type Zn-finger protein
MNKQPKVDKISIKSNEKLVLCRCFESSKFPLCDGSHRELQLDKGPIIVEHKD